MCNLKSNKTLREILEYKKKIGNIESDNIKFILFPSNIYLSFFYDVNYEIGCQDLSIYKEGSHTGQTLAKQLTSLKVKYCLLNHAEQNMAIDELIIKIKNASLAKIKVILFLGEEQINDREDTKNILITKLETIMHNLTTNEQRNLIIAYEPTWAINQKEITNYEEIVFYIQELKDHIKTTYNLTLPIIYGGGVNEFNIANLLKYDIIDGFILGNSSLNPDNILNILNKF